MNKKAQFYFLAIILFASVFISLISLSNSISSPSQPRVIQESEELNIEINSLLNYFSHQSISDSLSKEILVNFSKSYINKIGKNKNIFFIFGKIPYLTIVGNKLNGTSLLINVGSGNQNITETGVFQKDYALSGTTTPFLILDGEKYNFTFYEGENVYYLIKYIYNSQTFIIRG